MKLKTLFLGALLTGSLHAQNYKPSPFGLSLGALVAGTTLDIHSSWGLEERNPLVGRGTFGARQAVTVAGITGGVVLFEYWAVKKWPRTRRVLTYVNFGGAGAHVEAAIHNYGLR